MSSKCDEWLWITWSGLFFIHVHECWSDCMWFIDGQYCCWMHMWDLCHEYCRTLVQFLFRWIASYFHSYDNIHIIIFMDIYRSAIMLHVKLQLLDFCIVPLLRSYSRITRLSFSLMSVLFEVFFLHFCTLSFRAYNVFGFNFWRSNTSSMLESNIKCEHSSFSLLQ